MEKINYFPSYLLDQYESNAINRQEYFSKLFSHDKQFQVFYNSYLNFCKLQETETCNPSSDCLLFKGICSSIFSRKTPKIVNLFLIFARN